MRYQIVRRLFTLLVTVLAFSGVLEGQTVEDLKQQLEEATDTRSKIILNYELGEAYYSRDADEAFRYARKSHDLAIDDNNYAMAAESAFLLGRTSEKLRNRRNAEVWYESTLRLAKQANDADLIIQSVQRRSRLAEKERDYRDAYQIVSEAFDFFSERGKSISDLEREFERQRLQLDREKKQLERQKELLEQEIESLSSERNRLSSEKTQLSRRQEQLLSEKEKVEEEISERESLLDSVSRAKERFEQVAQQKEQEVKQLTRQKLEQEAIVQAERAAKAEYELAAERSRTRSNRLMILAGAGVLLAVLLLLLFLSTRRSKRSLEEKNRLIDTERERSDELLLNILPAPIAEELKEHGKAKAHKYEEVTVLFSDFQNFTLIAEQLSPEALVEELDKCFKAFDFIISQYEDIEKIKTIGDAYMCASGLTGRRKLPVNIVKAALEMQQFLEDHKAENARLGKPFFEARIGLHTGPVVAGVVGVKKFAYDIWGDTVNTASRVETNGGIGKVNISETTYNQIKYHFDCQYRGKVEAKNKGMLDMYYVLSEKQMVKG